MNDKEIKYLGIDWGTQRIGLAIGDSTSRTAVPYNVVGNLDDILNIIKEEEIDEFVLGLPVGLHGNTEVLNKDFTDFFDKLKNRVSIPVHTVDERLSSKAADALPGDKKNKAPRDAIAAMLILQSYLDRLN